LDFFLALACSPKITKQVITAKKPLIFMVRELFQPDVSLLNIVNPDLRASKVLRWESFCVSAIMSSTLLIAGNDPYLSVNRAEPIYVSLKNLTDTGHFALSCGLMLAPCLTIYDRKWPRCTGIMGN
jgi:hypothetical protein